MYCPRSALNATVPAIYLLYQKSMKEKVREELSKFVLFKNKICPGKILIIFKNSDSTLVL